jgi:hypothetical protein
MGTACSSESILAKHVRCFEWIVPVYQTTRRHIWDDIHLRSRRCENRESCVAISIVSVFQMSCADSELILDWRKTFVAFPCLILMLHCTACMEQTRFFFLQETVAQPLDKLRTGRFITMFIRTCHWSVTWARRIQSIPRHPVSLKTILLAESKVRSCYVS